MGTWLPDRQKPANSERYHKPALQWFGGGEELSGYRSACAWRRAGEGGRGLFWGRMWDGIRLDSLRLRA
ncbi:MAG: hypothetical protein JWP98_143 [Edaphobacter sp.]|nr:hypothetical protein [Edaphobacter sp.]